MKKFFVVLLTVISVYTQAATPLTGDKVSPQIQSSLEKEFNGAQYIVWKALKKDGIFQARFLYNNEVLNAFFDQEGNLLATGRLIAQAALPLMISKNLSNKYQDYEFRDATEYTKDGETTYLVTLENTKTKLVLQAYSNGSLYIFKKEKKNLSARL
jgi:hypothetical protein